MRKTRMLDVVMLKMVVIRREDTSVNPSVECLLALRMADT